MVYSAHLPYLFTTKDMIPQEDILAVLLPNRFELQSVVLPGFLVSFFPFLLSIFGLFCLLYLVRKLLCFIVSVREPAVFLELTPPQTTKEFTFATQQFFSLLHALGEQQGFFEKLIGKKKRFSLELVSTKHEGIRYVIQTTKQDEEALRATCSAYIPYLRITPLPDYLPNKNLGYTIYSYSLSAPSFYPLQTHFKETQFDPIAYITSMMTTLQDNELIALQIILSPQKPLSSTKFLENTLQEQSSEIKEKVSEHLFNIALRVYMSSSKKAVRTKRLHAFSTAFAPFTKYPQALKHRYLFFFFDIQKFLFFLFQKRFLFGNTSVLSTSELACLYHFPNFTLTKTENVVKVYSKVLPAPLSLKQKTTLDIVFAKNVYDQKTTPIGLTKEERRRHMYILGATGSGKSTMLLSMITSDITNGKGVAVIDPHGDMVETILGHIPNHRITDVIYCNPDDIAHPIGINLLELSKGLSPDDSLREKEFLTESIISLFTKLFGEQYSGPRMEYILRNTIHTAFTTKNPTIFTIYHLLTNPSFRKTVTATLTDTYLKDFWKHEFARAGDYQKVKMISPITNKIGRFLFSPIAKRILEQEHSTIDFDAILSQGKILLCNLSKGKLGEDTTNVFGVLLLTKIQLAAMKRARITETNRNDFYLYVDEFQNFATPSFAQILSEARKYRLNAILAHQTTSQLTNTSLVYTTLANTGTVICFKTANPHDELLILPQFYPSIKQGEIANLPPYMFYIKKNAVVSEEPFSGETILLEKTPDVSIAQTVIQASQKQYTKPYEAKNTGYDNKPMPQKQVLPEQTKIHLSGGV